MGYFPVRYDSRLVIYDRRGFIRLGTVLKVEYKLFATSLKLSKAKFITISIL